MVWSIDSWFMVIDEKVEYLQMGVKEGRRVVVQRSLWKYFLMVIIFFVKQEGRFLVKSENGGEGDGGLRRQEGIVWGE